MESINALFQLFSSPLVQVVFLGFLIYLGLLWVAIVIWVGRDIINRSNSLFLQTFVILLNIVLPLFGLILYLILRPSKTLLEKYYDEMEHQFLKSELQGAEQHCSTCKCKGGKKSKP